MSKILKSKAAPKVKILEIASVSGEGQWKQQIRDAKAKLIREISPYLETRGGESNEELQARLIGGIGHGGLSNSKLIKLHQLVQRLKADFGGKKENIVNALMETQRGATKDGKPGKVNEDFRTHLNKKSIATLIHMYDHAKKTGNL